MLEKILKSFILEKLEKKQTEKLIYESLGTDGRRLVDDIFFKNKQFEVNGHPVKMPNLVQFFYNNIFLPELKNGNIKDLSDEERLDFLANAKNKESKTTSISEVGNLTIWNIGFSWIVYIERMGRYFKVSGIETSKFVAMATDILLKKVMELKDQKSLPTSSTLSHSEQKKREQEHLSKNNVPAVSAQISNDRTFEPPKAKKTIELVTKPQELEKPKSEAFKSQASDEDLQKAKTHILRKKKE